MNVDEKLSQLETEIKQLKERNARVEANKAWEGSVARKAGIAIITYFYMVGLMYFLDSNKPLLDAVVPTSGFLLSTLSLDLLRMIWSNL